MWVWALISRMQDVLELIGLVMVCIWVAKGTLWCSRKLAAWRRRQET